MSGADEPAAPGSATAPASRGRAWRWIGRGILALVALVGAALLLLDTGPGHRFIADRIAALRPSNGLRYSVGRIAGSIYGKAVLIDVRVRDKKGLVLAVPRGELDWQPFAWLSNRLSINYLIMPVARLAKLPSLEPSLKPKPILPGFDIAIGGFRVDRLIVDPAVTGQRRIGRLSGHADVRAGRALVAIDGVVAGSDRLKLLLDAEPDGDRFDIDLHATSTADGLLSRAVGLTRPIAIDIDGDGRWRQWQGRAVGTIGSAPAIDLALSNRAGNYALNGTIMPRPFGQPVLTRLGSPRIAVRGAARFADRVLDGQLSLASSALLVETAGAVDLGRNRFRDLRTRAALRQPAALNPKMVGRQVELRAILDGAFDGGVVDYRLSAGFLSFGKEGFEGVRAGGRGKLAKGSLVVPLNLRVARVTGVDAVAGAILANLAIDGALRASAKTITGQDLRLRTDKLAGTADLAIDLRRGRYDAAIDGALRNYLVPGLGIVDVVAKLQVAPDPSGKGARITGKASADLLRLDNSFFRSLGGGLPRLTARIEQSTDAILHLHDLALAAPDIRITGDAYRRRDGSFVFDGSGNQAQYGPLTLALDGRIERPTLDIGLAHPADALGLADVRAHLDPTAEGYDLTAMGGSTLGDFTGRARLLLPKGENAVIEVAALNAGGIKARGRLTAGTGGFDGRLTLAGGDATGALDFSPVNAVQRIEGHIVAENATVLGDATLRRGRLDIVALLDPDGASIEATAGGAGLRRGTLALGRFDGKISLRGGNGTATANVAGTRGRRFDIRSEIEIAPGQFRISASGTIDRRALSLAGPAIVTRDGDAWQLADTRLRFAGGEALVGGRFSSRAAAVDASITQMPLSIVEIAYPGLGLSGTASGRLSYAQGEGRAPTGKVDMMVRGLSRAGLVLSSAPIDVGVAGVLEADRGAFRAVMASSGKTIGRAQARLEPLGSGGLRARLANAQLFAQLRYDGPADTLWRLTGIELFDLSGPVAIGADLTGKVNDPRIRGAVRAKGARIESATTGTLLTNVDAAGSFSGSRLTLTSLSADAGKGGRVTGTGDFDFAAVNGFGIDLNVQATNAELINRDDIAASVTGPLTFRSDGSGGVIGGDVLLTSARYRLGQAAAATAVPQLNIREINVPDGEDFEDRRNQPWALAIKARAPNGLKVNGLGLSSEWSAVLDIGGLVDNPKIVGQADIQRGTYEFSGREFDIERGIIRFQGEVPADPAIDIAANADASGLSATIRVSGPATRPQISFSSIPALPQDELLSRLLFGTSITNLSAPEALQLAASVASLQNGGGGLRPINALRRAVGLDRLRILSADPTVGRTGSSIAAGKFITRRLYAEIISDGAGYSATQVEFRVTRWLSILSTISTVGRQSANVRISKDY